jgi:hypothetical protein
MYFSFPASLDRLLKERWAYLTTAIARAVDDRLSAAARLTTLLAYQDKESK